MDSANAYYEGVLCCSLGQKVVRSHIFLAAITEIRGGFLRMVGASDILIIYRPTFSFKLNMLKCFALNYLLHKPWFKVPSLLPPGIGLHFDRAYRYG